MSALEAEERGLCVHCTQSTDSEGVPLCRKHWEALPATLRRTITRGKRWRPPAFYAAWSEALAWLEQDEARRASQGTGR